jgi:uncharacterized protein DUF6916
MSVSRRKFMKSGTLTALTAGFTLSTFGLGFAQKSKQGGPSVDRKSPIKSRDPLGYYTCETFEPYIGSIFQAPNALGKMVSLTLMSVTPYQPQAKTKIATKTAAGSDSFSLTFKASKRLPQFTSIYKVSHPALGKFDLFLKPYETADGTIYYEAVFNRLR